MLAVSKIDEFGRVVIPKSIRRDAGFDAGAEVEIEGTPMGVVLRLRQAESPVRRVGHVLVYGGTATGDLEAAVQRARAARTKAVLGDR